MPPTRFFGLCLDMVGYGLWVLGSGSVGLPTSYQDLYIIETCYHITMTSPPYPLDPEIEALLDPQYVEFYNKYIIDQQQVHLQPIEKSRASGTLIPGGGTKRPVAKIEDFTIKRTATEGENFKVRVFTPVGDAPSGGFPIFLYFHGGGWVLGNIDTENVHCTYWADIGKCICVSVDYRLAPENPFPAAVDDAWEAYLWLVNGGGENLGGNINRLGAGGSSAGGNLTAILSHMIIKEQNLFGASLPLLKYQILIVPVTDNTANKNTYESWKKYENTAALPAEKMMWYRYHYLPDEKDWTNPKASPLFYGDKSFALAPPAFIAVAGLDVLRGEGEAYHAKLVQNGVSSTLKVYEGVPHVVMAMNGVLDKGEELVMDCANAIRGFNK